MDILIDEIVNQHYRNLKETDLIIWKYISANRRACCKSSIYQIAEACNVSRTTVLRFAQKLGLSGFSELKALLIMDCKQKDTKQINDSKDLIQLYSQIVSEMQNKDFSKINVLLDQARHIFAYGTGNMQNNVLHEMQRLFQCSGDYITIVEGDLELSYLLKNASSEDLVILVSFSGETPTAIELAKNLCIRNIPTIAITRLKDNTLASTCTENLYVYTMDYQFYSEYKGYRIESAVGYFIAVETMFMHYKQYKEQLERNRSVK